MATLLLYTFLFFGLVANTANYYKVSDLRTYLQKAGKDEDAGQEFNKLMANYNGKDPVVLGFKAASEGVMAKYAWSPYAKLKHLRTSADLFEEALKPDKNNPEVCFLRMAIEFYIPRYLGMSENIENDKRIVLAHLKAYPDSELDAEGFKMIRDHLVTSDMLTDAEKAPLRNLKP